MSFDVYALPLPAKCRGALIVPRLDKKRGYRGQAVGSPMPRSPIRQFMPAFRPKEGRCNAFVSVLYLSHSVDMAQLDPAYAVREAVASMDGELGPRN